MNHNKIYKYKLSNFCCIKCWDNRFGMSLTLNNDSGIGFALIALSRSSGLMSEAMERLSTGKRINKASDDPAGIH